MTLCSSVQKFVQCSYKMVEHMFELINQVGSFFKRVHGKFTRENHMDSDFPTLFDKSGEIFIVLE